jgi:hypothetical protein
LVIQKKTPTLDFEVGLDSTAPHGQCHYQTDARPDWFRVCEYGTVRRHLTAQRLKSLAQSHGLSMNKLVEQLSAHALAAWGTENDFRAMAANEDVQKALAALDRLHTEDGVAATR